MIISKFGEDKLDAQWLARLTEMGLLRPSFVPPKPIRDLRGLHPGPDPAGRRPHPLLAAAGEAAGAPRGAVVIGWR